MSTSVSQRRRARILIAALHIAATAGCGKKASRGSEAAQAEAVEDGDGGGPMDAPEADAWTRAAQGEDDDLIRLTDLEGCEGLRERALDERLKPTAIRAMAYCQDFSQLPWLVQVGSGEDNPQALDALDAIGDEAARPRRAIDPDDAKELHDGCRALLALAKTASAGAPRRVRAIRALRMLADRGCVKEAEIPTDLDPK